MTEDHNARTTQIEVGRVGHFLERLSSIRFSARCPTCGEPVGELTNGAYACDSGGRGMHSPHIWQTRSELDGDIKWWHGRLPLMGILLVMAIYGMGILLKVAGKKALGRLLGFLNER